jgi:hypothetical protein
VSEDFPRGSVWTYLVLAVIFVGVTSLAYALPAQSALASIAGNVGVVALVGALFQLFRDQAAHEKALTLKRDDQHFQVAVTSHMSNVVFDKHVLFCEAYMAKVHETVETLIRHHANTDAITRANELYTVRVQHSTWVTAAMSARLSQFEDAIRKMGAQARFIETTTGHPQYAEQRATTITFVYAEFQRILPQLFSTPAEDGIGSETIEERVREMLGVNELVDMRTALIHRAHNAVQTPSGVESE